MSNAARVSPIGWLKERNAIKEQRADRWGRLFVLLHGWPCTITLYTTTMTTIILRGSSRPTYKLIQNRTRCWHCTCVHRTLSLERTKAALCCRFINGQLEEFWCLSISGDNNADLCRGTVFRSTYENYLKSIRLALRRELEAQMLDNERRKRRLKSSKLFLMLNRQRIDFVIINR